MKKSFIYLIILIVATGCYWENEETLFPDSGLCDTLLVSFSEDVLPILTNNCFGCHSNLNAPDFTFGIAFEDYEDIAFSSNLIVGAIKHSDGFPQMPKNRAQLDTCQINTIEAWVNQGTLEN